MPLRHLHNVYLVKIGRDGKATRHIAGRFLTAGHHLHIIDDYHRILGDHLTEGPLTMDSFNQIHDLHNSQYLDVINQDDLEHGKRPDLLPEAKLEPMPQKRAPSFEYQHNGSDQPDHIEFHDGVPHFNGVPTTHTHINSLLDNVKSKFGVVRYKKDKEAAIQKMETVLDLLLKADTTDLTDAFSRLRELVKAGHLDPGHERALAKYVYKDPLVPELGNKFAYGDFLARPHEGVHLVMDGNDFKAVNDTYGHPVGDEAIKAYGRALRESMDESVGKDKGKLFRMGGDEFAAHIPDHEAAAKFARTLRSKLEAIPPVGGSHRLSMSIGFGHTPEVADKALYEAKKQKFTPETQGLPDGQRVSRFPKGTAPNFAHSLVPGMEGPVPLDQSQLNIKPVPPPPVKDYTEGTRGAAEGFYDEKGQLSTGWPPPAEKTSPAPQAPVVAAPKPA